VEVIRRVEHPPPDDAVVGGRAPVAAQVVEPADLTDEAGEVGGVVEVEVLVRVVQGVGGGADLNGDVGEARDGGGGGLDGDLGGGVAELGG